MSVHPGLLSINCTTFFCPLARQASWLFQTRKRRVPHEWETATSLHQLAHHTIAMGNTVTFRSSHHSRLVAASLQIAFRVLLLIPWLGSTPLFFLRYPPHRLPSPAKTRAGDGTTLQSAPLPRNREGPLVPRFELLGLPLFRAPALPGTTLLTRSEPLPTVSLTRLTHLYFQLPARPAPSLLVE